MHAIPESPKVACTSTEAPSTSHDDLMYELRRSAAVRNTGVPGGSPMELESAAAYDAKSSTYSLTLPITTYLESPRPPTTVVPRTRSVLPMSTTMASSPTNLTVDLKASTFYASRV